MSPGKGSTLAVDKAQASSTAAALDGFHDEGDAFLDRQASGRCAHFGSDPAGRHEKQGALIAAMTSQKHFISMLRADLLEL
jgi:hypothetical protein